MILAKKTIFFWQKCNKIDFFQSIERMIADKEHIVAACQEKDPKAMKQLYEELAPQMLGVCMRYTHSRDEAQDVLHDGFIKVYENIGKLQDVSSLESWVYHIMVNQAVDYVKSNAQVVYFDTNSLADIAVDDDGELDLDYTNSRAKDVVAVLQSMPERLRVVFNMHAVEEISYEEIAKRLKLPMATVRSQMARAKRMIIKRLNMKGFDNE
jgi:RNA polymerase sigma-70 factor (ECF subfamily)